MQKVKSTLAVDQSSGVCALYDESNILVRAWQTGSELPMIDLEDKFNRVKELCKELNVELYFTIQDFGSSPPAVLKLPA